jgi:hypothetical protein
MTAADLLPATVLKRKAVVYLRQSTQTQIQTNLESQRRQYGLVDEARRRTRRPARPNVRRSAIQGAARRVADLRACRLRLGPRDGPRLRSRHAAPGGDPSHLREVPRAGQRAASSLVPGGGSAAFSSTVRRQANDRLRLDADPLSQRHIGPQESILRRRLHLREERASHGDRRRACAEDLRTRKAVRGMGGRAQGSSRRLHRLGRVRAEPEAARGERLRPCRRGQIGSWRSGAAGRSAWLRPMRPSPQGRLLWTQGTRLSLRQSKPYFRCAALPDLWQFARRFGPCPSFCAQSSRSRSRPPWQRSDCAWRG